MPLKKKKNDVLDLLVGLVDAGCGGTVTLLHKEKGSVVDNKKLDGFLKDKDVLLKQWELTRVSLSIPKLETEEVNATEVVLDGPGAD